MATTKAYSAQLVAMDVLAVKIAAVRGQVTEEQVAGYLEALAAIPDQIGRVLEEKQRLQWFSTTRNLSGAGNWKHPWRRWRAN